MRRLLKILLTCTIPIGIVKAGDVASSYEERIEAQYHAVVAERLKANCVLDSEELLKAQSELATNLGLVTKETSPRALLYAVTANSLEDAIRLHKSGAPLVGDNGSLLHAGAAFASPAMLEFLSGVGIWIDTVEGAGGTPLMVAVAENRLENVEWLIDNGADVNYMTPDKGTALRYALVCKNQNIVNLLQSAGAVPDQKTRELALKYGVSLKGGASSDASQQGVAADP